MQELCRLRSGNRIRGYRRTEEGTFFFSRDFFWWSGIAIHHDEIDPFTGFKDINNRSLFAWDVVTFKSNFFSNACYVIAINSQGQFELRKNGSSPTRPLEYLKNKKGLKLVGHHFQVAARQSA